MNTVKTSIGRKKQSERRGDLPEGSARFVDDAPPENARVRSLVFQNLVQAVLLAQEVLQKLLLSLLLQPILTSLFIVQRIAVVKCLSSAKLAQR